MTSDEKGGRIGFAAEPVDTEINSPASTVKVEKEPVTPVSESTADTALILVDVSFDGDEEVVLEISPVNCQGDGKSVVKKIPSPRNSHRR